MKVKIKKEGNEESFNLIDSWSDVTLEKWADLVATHEGTKSEEAFETITSMSDIPRELVSQLALSDVVGIMDKISELQSLADSSLKNLIEIDGVEYGFHPDLSDITLGEFADLETMIKQGIEDNLPEIMAVLYRPITEKKGGHYSIQAYDGALRLRAEEMKKMKAEDVEGALVFFWRFVKKLLILMPSYLMAQTEAIVKTLQTRTSQTSGLGLA
jgi:hypothetical protein|tara:strand:- start:953 stop:1594 length:642 start_codon:yes stop_codon:yes gene_type:complete